MTWLAALFLALWTAVMAWCAVALMAVHRYWTRRGRYDRWRQGQCLECGYPLNHVIFGGESLSDGDDYILSLKSPQQVRDVAAALRGITREKLRAGYDRIDPGNYGMPLSDDDFEYTWDSFQGVLDFYQRAAAAGHSVLFTADQ